MNNKINWFWAHRRNSSLHHFSFLIHGLSSKGWMPAVNFWFNNQIVIGVPGKGCYVFYDKDQLSSNDKYKDIQESIDKNPNFVSDFKKRTDELFGALFSRCDKIDNQDLKKLNLGELGKLYDDFIKTIMVGPLITVQLWGIEACLDEDYVIIKFLKKRLDELKKEKEFQNYKDFLLINEGETVAFSEKKDFYHVAIALDKSHIVELFKKNIDIVKKELKEYKEENEFINQHIKKYYWINTEYVSEGWSRKKWLELFKKTLLDNKRPKELLDELMDNFNKFVKQKKDAIGELNPPKNVRHAINVLSEFIAQRDWTKGYVAKAFLSYNKLLQEIAKRIGIDFSDILLYSYQELDDYFKEEKTLSQEEIKNRARNGFALVIKGGELSLFTGNENIDKVIQKESIGGPFKKLSSQESFKGMSASLGKAIGKARVIEDALNLEEFEEGEILVTYMTTIEFIPLFKKTIAVVTDEGGMSSHAAIISREFKLPCIVGTKVATRIVQTGDLIEVDADKGIVRILKNG